MRSIHVFRGALVAALALTLGLSACDRRKQGESGDLSPQTGASNPTPDDTADLPSNTATVAPPPASTASQPAGARLNPADESFIEQASHANEEEIATTELGMSRGSAKTQELSRMLNSDHIALRDRMTELSPNRELAEGAAPADLKDLPDEAFEGKLLATYRTQHEKAIRAFTDASTNPTLSEPIRALAGETLPTLKSHLKAVTDAQASE